MGYISSAVVFCIIGLAVTVNPALTMFSGRPFLSTEVSFRAFSASNVGYSLHIRPGTLYLATVFRVHRRVDPIHWPGCEILDQTYVVTVWSDANAGV